MAQTLFERYGGFGKINRVVASFYDRVLDSPSLGPYFENTDMRQQIGHMTKMVATLMGGPASYSDEELARRHAHLNIDESAFMEVATLFVETLEDFDFLQEDIDLINGVLMGRKQTLITH